LSGKKVTAQMPATEKAVCKALILVKRNPFFLAVVLLNLNL